MYRRTDFPANLVHRNINAPKGNLWHACAVEHFKESPDATFDFARCMLQNMIDFGEAPKEVALKCTKDVGVSSGNITSCAIGHEGE